MRRRSKLAACALLGLVFAISPVASAQQPDPNNAPNPEEPRRGRMHRLQQQAMRFIRQTRELGNWDEHYEYIMDAAERVYDRNGWSSEPDLFSLEMMREVGRIPPWEVQQRFTQMLDMVGERYLLNDDQKQLLQNMVARESFGIFSRHAPQIMQYSMEALRTRAAGEPFTPEQIARWTELATPVIEDVVGRIDAGAQVFMERLDPEQRELVQRDLAATHGRIETVAALAEQWRAGQWDASDWGLEEDPIQTGQKRRPQTAEDGPRTVSAQGGDPAVEQAEQSQGSRGRSRRGDDAPRREGDAAPPPAPPDADARRGGEGPPRDSETPPARGARDASDNDPWTRYVREFISRYKLNDEQQQRAWLLHEDAVSRRDTFAKRAERLAEERKSGDPASPTSAAATDLAERQRSDEERLFTQLKQRLERLPTRQQRREAEAAQAAASRPARRSDKP